mgnify:CR=1 FL=1
MTADHQPQSAEGGHGGTGEGAGRCGARDREGGDGVSGQPVRIASSPYSDVRKGEHGRFVSVKNYCRHGADTPNYVEEHCRDRWAVWRVEFSGGRSRLFWPKEVVLCKRCRQPLADCGVCHSCAGVRRP